MLEPLKKEKGNGCSDKVASIKEKEKHLVKPQTRYLTLRWKQATMGNFFMVSCFVDSW